MAARPTAPPNRITSPVKSATRALDIVEYVIARGAPVVAQEIAAGLAIPVSSLSYLLTTLVDRDYLARDGRRYSAGPGIARLQPRAAEFSLRDRVAPLVRALRVQLNETASFFIQAGWQVEALVTETGDHALSYAVRIGAQTPLHGFAAGKAILAAMPDDDIARYLAATTRTAFTPATITAADGLRREIDAIRRHGVARTREEHTPGIQGIARVARDGDAVLGAFSVAVPTVRFDAALESRAAALLAKTCALLTG